MFVLQTTMPAITAHVTAPLMQLLVHARIEPHRQLTIHATAQPTVMHGTRQAWPAQVSGKLMLCNEIMCDRCL